MYLFLLAASAFASPSSAVTFVFDPHFLNTPTNDAALEDYGFAPVNSGFVPFMGVRGRVFFDNDITWGMVAEFAFTSNRADATPVPTTTSFTKLGSIIGYSPWTGVFAELDVGFGALTHSVGSLEQGGALLYLGPYVHPRVAFAPLRSSPFLQVGLGWMVQVPVSRPHSQPLWEEPFDRAIVHGPSVAIQIGMGVNP